MSLYRLLQQRVAPTDQVRGLKTHRQPVRVGLIGVGKFGSTFLNQVPTVPGLEVSVIADLDPERARNACQTVGWDAARIARTAFVASGAEACADPGIEVIVEATGSPPAGIAHARAAVLSTALRGEPTGQPHGFRGDVVAVAKRALHAGETLDGEGGYTVWGKLVPAERSLAEGALPIGLAHKLPLLRDIAAGEIVRRVDVGVPESEAVLARRDMEHRFAAPPAAIAAQ